MSLGNNFHWTHKCNISHIISLLLNLYIIQKIKILTFIVSIFTKKQYKGKNIFEQFSFQKYKILHKKEEILTFVDFYFYFSY